jgi:hypothetical protein
MARTVRLSLCVLILFAAVRPAAMARSAGENPTRPDLDAATTETISSIPHDMEPVCAQPDGGVAPWATRYPKEYRDWQESVHGVAYLSGNADAPGCTDCHEDPESEDIRTASFRLDIPSRCARCHDDEQLMRDYGVATDVYASYRADYHGFTIGYYRNYDRSMWRYEAVCSDCHASHAIHEPSDSRSSVAPASLLETCRKCHRGAEASFTATTAGHFRVDRENSLPAYYIRLIYEILIPTVIGLMAAYVGLDVIHRLRKKFRGMK